MAADSSTPLTAADVRRLRATRAIAAGHPKGLPGERYDVASPPRTRIGEIELLVYTLDANAAAAPWRTTLFEYWEQLEVEYASGVAAAGGITDAGMRAIDANFENVVSIVTSVLGEGADVPTQRADPAEMDAQRLAAARDAIDAFVPAPPGTPIVPDSDSRIGGLARTLEALLGGLDGTQASPAAGIVTRWMVFEAALDFASWLRTRPPSHDRPLLEWYGPMLEVLKKLAALRGELDAFVTAAEPGRDSRYVH